MFLDLFGCGRPATRYPLPDRWKASWPKASNFEFRWPDPWVPPAEAVAGAKGVFKNVCLGFWFLKGGLSFFFECMVLVVS